MKQIKKISLIAISLLILSGCHNKLIHNRADEYRKAVSIAPMAIPSEYKAMNMTAYYPVPDINPEDVKPVDLTPPRVTR